MLKLMLIKLMLTTSILGISIQNDSGLQKLKQVTSFNIYKPSHFESATNYEIKTPYSQEEYKNPKYILVNYFDDKGKYVFGLRENKNTITQDLNANRTEKTRTSQQKSKFETRVEQVLINGNEGRYVPYVGRNATGGILTWSQSDTCIELDTANLSKESLIKIAGSMVKID